MNQKMLILLNGLFTAVVTFVAVFYLLWKIFKSNLTIAIFWGAICAVLFFAWTAYSSYASFEIKRIAAEFHLEDQDLAQITGLNEQYFHVYHNQLELVLPKRYLPLVFKKMKELEKTRK